MDTERALVSRLIQVSAADKVVSRGVEPQHFADEDVRKVYQTVVDHMASYRSSPSLEAIRAEHPDFRLEVTQDPIEYLLDRFVKDVKRRTAITLGRDFRDAIDDDERVGDIEVIALEMARELTQVVPAPRISRFSDMPDRIAEYERRKEAGEVYGLLMGIPSFDELTLGIQPHELVMVMAYLGTGKAQPLDAKVLAPDGWRLMGDLEPGDPVIGGDGDVTTVQSVHEQGTRKIYRVSFSDGTSTECCAEHLWNVRILDDQKAKRSWRTLELREFMDDLRFPSGQYKWYVPLPEPVRHPRRDLPVDPYLLGALLGDGNLQGTPNFCTADQEMVELVGDRLPEGVTMRPKGKYGYSLTSGGTKTRTNPLTDALKAVGAYGSISPDKVVPAEYMVSSVEQRLGLLRGLMDTDGSVAGSCGEFTSVSERLASAVVDLVRSLGGRASITSRVTSYTDKHGDKKQGRRSWRVVLSLPDGMNPFLMRRKADLFGRRTDSRAEVTRIVTSVEEVGEKDCRCIVVESDDSLYVTDDYVVTHNSTLMQRIFYETYLQGRTPLMISLEMDAETLLRRFDGMATQARYWALKALELEDSDKEKWERVAERADAERHERDILIVDDIKACSVEKVAAEAIRYKPDLVGVDYLGLMSTSRNSDTKGWEKMRDLSVGLKASSRVLRIPHLVATQGNAETGKGNVSIQNFGEFYGIARDCDLAVGLHQDDDMKEHHEMGAFLIKNRDGMIGQTTLHWDLTTMSIFEPSVSDKVKALRA